MYFTALLYGKLLKGSGVFDYVRSIRRTRQEGHFGGIRVLLALFVQHLHQEF